jgi:hypothetical protein
MLHWKPAKAIEARNWMWSAVIPISVGNAFLYGAACRFELEDFKKLDGGMIEQIGRDEVGRMRWKKLSRATEQI